MMTKCWNSGFWWTLSILQAMMIITSHLTAIAEAGAGALGAQNAVSSGDEDEFVATNFAFGGSMSDDNHRNFFCDEGMEFFQYFVLPNVPDNTCATYYAFVSDPYQDAGLATPGFSQQVDFAIEMMEDSDSGSGSGSGSGSDDEEEDVFFVMVGSNDFFGAPPCYYTGGTSCYPAPPDYTTPDQDYQMYTGAWTVKNIANNVEKMYNELGARYIIVANFREPCAYQEWFGNAIAPVCRLKDVLPDDFDPFVDRTWDYSRVWTDQVNAGLAKFVDDFNQEHSDASVMFADFETKIMAKFTQNSAWELETTCTTEYAGNYVPNADGIGTDCSNHCFLDNDHFTSEFIKELVEEVVPEITNDLPSSIRRLIAFGDSMVDNGSWADTQERAGGTFDTQSAPYVGTGSASNKYTFSEWLEITLNIDPMAEPFLQ